MGSEMCIRDRYRRREEIKRVPEDEGVNALIQLIKDDGKWIDP